MLTENIHSNKGLGLDSEEVSSFLPPYPAAQNLRCALTLGVPDQSHRRAQHHQHHDHSGQTGASGEPQSHPAAGEIVVSHLGNYLLTPSMPQAIRSRRFTALLLDWIRSVLRTNQRQI
jgi:hypothetical protein